MQSTARQLCHATSINENCSNWNDCIDVSLQDSENGTLYVGDVVGVEIFFLVAVESDGGIEVENVPSEEVAFVEAWVGCDEVALAWVLVEALAPQ